MPDDKIYMSKAEISGIVVTFACECGTEEQYEIDLECEGVGPGWTAPMEDRFVLCDGCGCVIDAGFVISIDPPGEGAPLGYDDA